MSYTKTWSMLTDGERDDIIKQLERGFSPLSIAEKYGLNGESLSRKWRWIRQTRREALDPDVPRTTSLAIEEQYIPPDDTVLYDFQSEKFYGKILGSAESLPINRYMYIETFEPISILFFTDTHHNQADPKACDAFIKTASVIPHDLIVHGGDALECYGLSRYGKDTNQIFKQSLRAEIKDWKEFNERLNKVTDAPKLIIAGNHMDRYFQWLNQNPAIMALEEFELDNLMKLEELGYQPMVNGIYFDAKEESDYPDPKLVIHHGTASRKYAGTSSRTESEAMGYISSISGHTHRLSVSYRKTLRGQVAAMEGGTLRTLQPGWMQYPDWSHGCISIQYDPYTGYVTGNPILFVDGEVIINGKML